MFFNHQAKQATRTGQLFWDNWGIDHLLMSHLVLIMSWSFRCCLVQIPVRVFFFENCCQTFFFLWHKILTNIFLRLFWLDCQFSPSPVFLTNFYHPLFWTFTKIKVHPAPRWASTTTPPTSFGSSRGWSRSPAYPWPTPPPPPPRPAVSRISCRCPWWWAWHGRKFLPLFIILFLDSLSGNSNCTGERRGILVLPWILCSHPIDCQSNGQPVRTIATAI